MIKSCQMISRDVQFVGQFMINIFIINQKLSLIQIKIMNNPKLTQKTSNTSINVTETNITKIKSKQKILKLQLDQMFTSPTDKLVKNDHMNMTQLSIFSPQNQKSLAYSSNHSDTYTKMRKLFYDQKKKNEEYQELKKSYDQLCEESKFVKEQNEKLVTFLKQKLQIKQPDQSQSFQSPPRSSKNLTTKRLLSIAKYQKSSHHHKQKNAKLQYTIDQLIKLIDTEWTNVMKRSIDLRNIDDLLSNSSHSLNLNCLEDPNLQQLHNILQQQKNQIQKTSKQNSDLHEELIKQKQKYEEQKKNNEVIHNQIVSKLQSQNKMLRQQISDLKAEYQTQERKLQAVIKIINQKPRLSSIYRVNNN